MTARSYEPADAPAKSKLRERVERGIYRRRTKDGTVRYEICFTNSDGKLEWRTVATLKEARDLRAQLVTKINEGERVVRSTATFGEYAEQWLVKQTRLKPGTFGLYESHLHIHLIPRYARRRIASITVTDIAALIGELESGVRYVERDGNYVKTTRRAKDDTVKPYAAWTTRGVLIVLGRVLGSAVRDGVINANPIHRLEQRERPEVERRDFPMLDRSDVANLISATPERYRCLVAVSVLTGIRQSEALGLTFADLDLKDGVLRVRRQLDRTGDYVTPKTKAAKRDVPLAPFLVRMLKTHKALAFERGFAKPTDPVFADETGQPLGHRRIVRAGLDPALATSGLPRLTWHDLRHVAASVLIGQDASVAYVARILGHASPSVTLAIYAHLFDAREHAEKHRDRMEADFADALALS